MAAPDHDKDQVLAVLCAALDFGDGVALQHCTRDLQATVGPTCGGHMLMSCALTRHTC